MVGYHCKYGNFNSRSLGVCLCGNFQDEWPSTEQLESLKKVLDKWCKEYGIPKKMIFGHRETGASTACPGDHLVEWLVRYRNEEPEEMTKEDVFKQCFITVAGRWPNEKEIKEWKKSSTEIYTYVQNNAPNVWKMSIETLESEIKSLKTKLKTSENEIDAGVKEIVRLKEIIRELEEKIKELGWYLGKEVEQEVNEVTKESLKELARVLLFALISFGIAKLSSLPETQTTVIGLAVLRFLDKAAHEYGKATDNETLIKGLSRF